MLKSLSPPVIAVVACLLIAACQGGPETRPPAPAESPVAAEPSPEVEAEAPRHAVVAPSVMKMKIGDLEVYVLPSQDLESAGGAEYVELLYNPLGTWTIDGDNPAVIWCAPPQAIREHPFLGDERIAEEEDAEPPPAPEETSPRVLPPPRAK